MNKLDKETLEARIKRFGFSEEVAQKIKKTERCFIVGMGPSLAKIDPAKFSDELVLGVNYVLRTGFSPDMVCVVDNRRYDKENFERSNVKVITVKQLADRRLDSIDKINSYYDIDYVDYNNGLKKNALHFDQFDPEFKQVFWGGTVVTDLAIPLLTYLGMKEIYIIGLDGVESSFPSTHAWGNDESSRGNTAHSSKLFHLYEKIAVLAKKNGTSVYNASYGGSVAAFPKINFESIKSEAVRRDFSFSPLGRFIVFGGRPFEIIAANDSSHQFRFYHARSKRYIRHRHGKVFSEIDDNSEQFQKDSVFSIEPSFVRSDWISLRYKDSYITAQDEKYKYHLKKANSIFSPYFSSFRPFKSIDDAQSRVDTDKILSALDQLKVAVGNIMIKNDKS